MRQGWEIKKLGEVLRIQNGYAFNSKLFTTELGVPLIRIRDIKNGFKTETNFNGPYEKKYEVHAGDFLIGMDGEFGCYEWKGDKALLNQRVCRLQEFNDRLNPRFLLYVINKYLKAIEDVTAFATVKHISSKQIEAIEIPLPPLPEQQRIVAILDEAFAAIAKAKSNAEQNLKNAKELFESYLQGVFENGKEIWEEKTLDEVCEFRNGAAHEQHIDEDGKYILVNSKFISADGEKFKRTNNALAPLYVNDIAFVMSDVPNGKALAKCFLVDKNDTYTLNQRIGAIKSKVFVPEFLVYQFNRNRYLLSFNNGENQTNLRKGDILRCPIWLPSKEEQQTIVRQLDALRAETQKLEAVYQQKLADLEELKKSILQKAFAGELTGASN